MKRKIKELSREKLEDILCKVMDILSEEEYKKLEAMVSESAAEYSGEAKSPVMIRMSQELVDEKLEQIKDWMQKIDEGKLYLDTEEYEDYSTGYWDSDWITEYYDNCDISDKLMTIIRFAKDCIDDRRYTEANFIYEWLWSMSVSPDNEYGDPLDLEMLVDNRIMTMDIKQLALLTLYADYQVQKPEKRAEDIFLYFGMYAFQQLHIEEMFHAGRESLTETERFWDDWIALLKTKHGDVAARLLQEAVLYRDGIDGLVKLADENGSSHPSLYLAAMKEYDKNHEYVQIEKLGQNAMKNLDSGLTIRSEIAMKTAQAADILGHTDEMMRFCWESFHSDSNVKNLLRLFGTKEMAEKYGLRGEEILCRCQRENAVPCIRDTEKRQNFVGEHRILELSFYTGDFKKVKEASKNPKGSLGWSGGFIPNGIRLLLLYLYDKPLPSKAASAIANYVGFRDIADTHTAMSFERKIIEESSKYKTSIFWNYFQRWKQYFPMELKEREGYLAWAEKIVYSRADALVGGQHRNHYCEAAQLLAIVGEVKEGMGDRGAKGRIFAEYKCKFPRHSSFQKEMKQYCMD